MMRRPSKRAFVIAGIGALLLVAGATAQSGWLFVLAAGVLGLVAGSLLSRHRLAGLEVRRSSPERVRVGDEARVGLTISNRGRRAVPLSVLDDDFPAFGPVRVGVDRLEAGAVAEAETVRVATKRGRYSGAGVRASSSAPFGLARSKKVIAVTSHVTVVPRWVELASFPLVEPSTGSDLLHERARTGAGEEFLGVREFRRGDPLRAVHWRSTARAGTLVVREFEQEMSSRVALVLAGTEDGDGPSSSFETLIAACASVGVYALTNGHPLLFVGDDDGSSTHLVDPSRGDLLDRLASVPVADVSLEPLVEEALERIGRHGSVVIFTTTEGNAGASIRRAVGRVHRAGVRPTVVAALSSSWRGETNGEPSSIAGLSVPTFILERDKELGSCLT